MKTITIRKNSTKKIQALLEQASSIVTVSGFFIKRTKEVSIEDAMHFLKSNYDSVYVKCEKDSKGNVTFMWMGTNKNNTRINVYFNTKQEQPEEPAKPEQEQKVKTIKICKDDTKRITSLLEQSSHINCNVTHDKNAPESHANSIKDALYLLKACNKAAQVFLDVNEKNEPVFMTIQSKHITAIADVYFEKQVMQQEQPQQEQEMKKVEVKLTDEQLSYSGCYAMSEEEFEREIENFVCNEDGTEYTLDKDGVQLSISYYKGDESNGELPYLRLDNFFVLSNKEPDEESYMELDGDDEGVNKTEFCSEMNIDAVQWHERFQDMGLIRSEELCSDDDADRIFESAAKTILLPDNQINQAFCKTRIYWSDANQENRRFTLKRQGFSGLIMCYEDALENATYRIHELVKGSHKGYRYCFHWIDLEGVVNIIEFALGESGEDNRRFIREAVELLCEKLKG